MNNKVLAAGIVLLSGFVGWCVWQEFYGGKVPLLSYRLKVEQIVGYAQDTTEMCKPPRNTPEELRGRASELRKLHNELIERASDNEKRRPSYRKADELVMQIEYAAQKPESSDVVEARFRRTRELIADVRSLLGTSQDEPQ